MSFLLGRPWQYDRHTSHDSFANTYNFSFKGRRITRIPAKKTMGAVTPTLDGVSSTVLGDPAKPMLTDNRVQFLAECQSATFGMMFILKPATSPLASAIPPTLENLSLDFKTCFRRSCHEVYHLSEKFNTALIWLLMWFSRTGLIIECHLRNMMS